MKLARRETTAIGRPPTVLVPLIRSEHQTGADHYRAAGKLLLEAKAHPSMKRQFKGWIARSFSFSYASAASYMRAATGKVDHGQPLRKKRTDPATRRQVQRHHVRVVEEEHKPPIREMARALIETGHRTLAMKMHPDKPGGSVAHMTNLNLARDVLVQCILDW